MHIHKPAQCMPLLSDIIANRAHPDRSIDIAGKHTIIVFQETRAVGLDMTPTNNTANSRIKWGLKRLISQSSFQRFKNSSLASRRYWGQFCRSTSIHGMRYLAEPNRSWIERFWWISVVFLGFFTAAYYVSRQFVKWSQTAIEVDSYQEHEDLLKIPFPAFTICDNRKIIYTNDTTDNLLTSHGHHGRSSDWNIETGYVTKAPMFDDNASEAVKTGPFPKRAKNAVMLSIFHEIDTLPGYCAGKSDGFKEDKGTVDKYIDIPAYAWDHDETNTSKICTGDYAMRCIHHAFDLWDKNKHECRCFPTCTALEYDSKTWYNVRPIENERASQGMNKTVIVVYSTDADYIKSERRATYSLVDFIVRDTDEPQEKRWNEF
ncbi:unnamed protein product [Nezara viridula]|uniref:Uncharacterized protein n=1 Tax=Nezara viridula TaxID=85310 RepID=A0A9P0MTD7_NEZVI|nr:unnamed protein product [Nezara viridula]